MSLGVPSCACVRDVRRAQPIFSTIEETCNRVGNTVLQYNNIIQYAYVAPTYITVSLQLSHSYITDKLRDVLYCSIKYNVRVQRLR